jgi:hypothetical protein
MAEETQGWGKPGCSRKWHYFKGPMSICGNIGFYFGSVEKGMDGSPDNCAKCMRELKKLQVATAPASSV